MDLALQLDESAVTSLLMGTRLYRTPYAAARELVQNAVDASIVRVCLASGWQKRAVEVSSSTDIEGRHWLEVRDHGIGMNERILRDHFFRVGASYYSSGDFQRILRTANVFDLRLISRFGIGFLASFMLADLVEIETRRAPVGAEASSNPGLRIRIERLGALAYVQEDHSIAPGTAVKLRLKQALGDGHEVGRSIGQYLKDTVIRPACPIEVQLPDVSFKSITDQFYRIRSPLELRGTVRESDLQLIEILLEKHSVDFQGRVFLLFFRDLTSGCLDIRIGDRLLEIAVDAQPGRVRVAPHWIFEEFGGNRITVGGFKMIFPKLSWLLRAGESYVPAVYDIEIRPGPDVEFDVARTRIRDDKLVLRTRLRQAIEMGLKSQGIFEQLTPRTRRLVSVKPPDDPFRLPAERLRLHGAAIDDETLLRAVEELIPASAWPINLHHQIAERLHISRTTAFNAISTLLIEKRVQKPAS